MRIEGIRDGDLKITLKQGQNIWPEWSVTDAAADVEKSTCQPHLHGEIAPP